MAGHVRAFLHKDAQAALWLHERAIALNPNLAMAWCYSGLAHPIWDSIPRQFAASSRPSVCRHMIRISFFFEMALGMPLLLTGSTKPPRGGPAGPDLNPVFVDL